MRVPSCLKPRWTGDGKESLHPRVLVKLYFGPLIGLLCGGLVEFCKRCGRSNSDASFHVHEDVWEQVRGGYNVLCVGCFLHLASRRIGSGHWELKRLI
jgi:hypothetical protein